MANVVAQKIPTLNLNFPLTQRNPEEYQCRICFETVSGIRNLIFPCKCAGTMKYVHEECLKLWIISSRQDIKESACDICKHQYTMEIKLAKKCSCKIKNKECFNLFIFPIIILIISTILSIVLAYLIKGIEEDTIKTEEKVYFSIVLLACLCILSTLIYSLVKTIIRSCCIIKVDKWHIKSIMTYKLDKTFEKINQTEIINTESAIEPVQIIQPKLAWYRGRNVIIPEINQVTVARVIQDRANYFSRQISRRSDNNTDRVNNPVPLSSYRERHATNSINI